MKRIRRLLYPAKQNSAWAPFLAGAIFIATAAVSLAAWQSEPQQHSSPAVPMQSDGTAPSPYSKWLNEDVIYIIDDTERAAFLRLTTDEERDKFIEQFWLRRNPAPGALTNKFKEEHYRRIAYANAHFGTAVPGWKTDRGHMYILYGPPDELDAHPPGTGRPYAIEVWLYRHIDGIGDNLSATFISTTGDSDFRLAPGNSLTMSGSVDGKQPDKMLLARAKEAMKNARYAEARGLCQTLIQSHPNSEYVPLAKLFIADAWYTEGNLKQAEMEYRDFLTFFPDRREVVEVRAKLAYIQEQKSPR
jgi:GWxTD domain-containing protein